MSQQLFIDMHLGAAETQSGAQPPASSESSSAEIAEGRLSQLKQLETSLLASQSALLSGDLEALQRETCEQLRLQRALDAGWLHNRADTESNPPGNEFATSTDLRAAQMRVLHLGRGARRPFWVGPTGG